MHSSSRDQRSGLQPGYFTKAEKQFNSLLELDDLDQQLRNRPLLAAEFEEALACSLSRAYGDYTADDRFHLFLQRVLYRINRFKLFWYDDLSHYKNEDSDYLRAIRNRIEGAWQTWELAQLGSTGPDEDQISVALRQRAQVDVKPSLSSEGFYFRDQMNPSGYRRLLQIASLDGLVEASQLSRTLGGVGNNIHSMMTRLLVEEYGGGRLSRKHSSFFYSYARGA